MKSDKNLIRASKNDCGNYKKKMSVKLDVYGPMLSRTGHVLMGLMDRRDGFYLSK